MVYVHTQAKRGSPLFSLGFGVYSDEARAPPLCIQNPKLNSARGGGKVRTVEQDTRYAQV
jgi:hypothetical protein